MNIICPWPLHEMTSTMCIILPYMGSNLSSINYKLGECRMLWGEHEQAMHYSIDCFVAIKALPVKYQITAHAQAIHPWLVVKTRFITLTVYKSA